MWTELFQFPQQPISLNIPANPFGHWQLSEPGCPWDPPELFTSSFTIHPDLWKHPLTCSIWYHPSSPPCEQLCFPAPPASVSCWLEQSLALFALGRTEMHCSPGPAASSTCKGSQIWQGPVQAPALTGETLRALRGSWGHLGSCAGGRRNMAVQGSARPAQLVRGVPALLRGWGCSRAGSPSWRGSAEL